MAISIIGTPQTGVQTNGSDVTLTFSTAPITGDIVITVGGTFNRASITPGPTTAGYTSIFSNTGSNPLFDVSYKRMGATPDTTVVCKGSGNAADGVAYACYVLRGVNPKLLDANNAGNNGFATAGPTASTNPDPPSVTTVSANTLVLVGALSTVTDASVTAPSNYTNAVSQNANASTNDYTVAMASRAIAGAGTAENPANWTQWSTGTWFTVTIVASPAIEGGEGNESVGLTDTGYQLGLSVVAESDKAGLTDVAFAEAPTIAFTAAESDKAGATDNASYAVDILNASV